MLTTLTPLAMNYRNDPLYSRQLIAEAILTRFDSAASAACRDLFASQSDPAWFVTDDLLPRDMAQAIYASFPEPSTMKERKTIREHKFVAAQMDRYDPQGEEALFAFQDHRVVELMAALTGLRGLEPDPMLYAGGLSVMGKGNFLNPHLDNSHDNERKRYRVLNLLYYVSPDWTEESGGHLELWPEGVEGEPVVLHSLFNRLVVMATGPMSWHSVTPVRADGRRCCVSNYYFSEVPVGGAEYSRVTTFRGRPEEPVKDLVLRADAGLRQALRKLKPTGLVRTNHLYKKPDETSK